MSVFVTFFRRTRHLRALFLLHNIDKKNIGADVLGGGTISPAIRVIDMGPDTAYVEGAGRIPP